MPLVGVFFVIVEHNTFLFFYYPIPISKDLIYALDGLLYARIEVIFDMVVAATAKPTFPQLRANLGPLLRVLPK